MLVTLSAAIRLNIAPQQTLCLGKIRVLFVEVLIATSSSTTAAAAAAAAAVGLLEGTSLQSLSLP
jgi:hypothetical protein